MGIPWGESGQQNNWLGSEVSIIEVANESLAKDWSIPNNAASWMLARD